MSKEKEIKDLMISLENYNSVTADAGFTEVVCALKDSHYPIVIVYENSLPVGFIGQDNIIKTIEPQFLEGRSYRGRKEWCIPVFWEELFTERCIEAKLFTAREIMNPVEFMLERSDPLIKAVYGLLKHNTGYLPVAHDGMLVGILRAEELFLEICSVIISVQAPVYVLDRQFDKNKKSDIPKISQQL